MTLPISIVIPVYNEEDAIVSTIDEIKSVCKKANINYESLLSMMVQPIKPKKN